MATVAIVYHSGYGHTKAIAEAVLKGAASVTHAQLISVTDADTQWDALAKADAIIFGAPTYMGSASAPMKAFMDASSKVWFTMGWKDKIAAGFTVSASQSGDKLSTLNQFVTFATAVSAVEPEIGRELHAAFNRYIVDYCAADPDRPAVRASARPGG